MTLLQFRIRLIAAAAALVASGLASYYVASLPFVHALQDEGYSKFCGTDWIALARNHLPDFVWCLALQLAIYSIWCEAAAGAAIAASLGLLISTSYEISQSFRQGGTFDWYDLLVALLAGLSFVLYFKVWGKEYGKVLPEVSCHGRGN